MITIFLLSYKILKNNKNETENPTFMKILPVINVKLL